MSLDVGYKSPALAMSEGRFIGHFTSLCSTHLVYHVLKNGRKTTFLFTLGFIRLVEFEDQVRSFIKCLKEKVFDETSLY